MRSSTLPTRSNFYYERHDMIIKAFRLITGEEVLSEVESESETQVVLCNPVGISIVRGQNGTPNIGFSPFPLHAEQKKGAIMVLNRKHVVYDYVPAQDFLDNYNQIFGSGIVLPNKQIITG